LLEAAWRLLSKRLLGRSAYLACTGHEIPIQGSNDDALLGTQQAGREAYRRGGGGGRRAVSKGRGLLPGWRLREAV
jgi:hypothetical protein